MSRFPAAEAFHGGEGMIRVVGHRAANLQDRTILHSLELKLLASCKEREADIPTSYFTQLPENADEDGEDSSQAISPDFSGQLRQITELVAERSGALMFMT